MRADPTSARPVASHSSPFLSSPLHLHSTTDCDLILPLPFNSIDQFYKHKIWNTNRAGISPCSPCKLINEAIWGSP